MPFGVFTLVRQIERPATSFHAKCQLYLHRQSSFSVFGLARAYFATIQKRLASFQPAILAEQGDSSGQKNLRK
jgi:hypothetical protein